MLTGFCTGSGTLVITTSPTTTAPTRPSALAAPRASFTPASPSWPRRTAVLATSSMSGRTRPVDQEVAKFHFLAKASLSSSLSLHTESLVINHPQKATGNALPSSFPFHFFHSGLRQNPTYLFIQYPTLFGGVMGCGFLLFPSPHPFYSLSLFYYLQLGICRPFDAP